MSCTKGAHLLRIASDTVLQSLLVLSTFIFTCSCKLFSGNILWYMFLIVFIGLVIIYLSTLLFYQLMKIAFDEEVGSENVETFRKLVNKVRNPPDVFTTYAFIGHMVQQATPLHKHKEKNASLR